MFREVHCGQHLRTHDAQSVTDTDALLLDDMRRILIIGSSGAGKSTFAYRLGQLLNLEVLHLDAFYWRPGWVETPKAEWRVKVEELIRRDAWIIDGNYSGTLDIRLAACDTVIFLDLSRLLCFWRALKRRVMYRNKSRPDMAEGCREKFDLEFARWIWNYPSRSRPGVVAMLAANSIGKKIIRLRTSAEVKAFLEMQRTERELKDKGSSPRL